jgi:hypothetical protein
VLGGLSAIFSELLIRARVPLKPVKPEITRYEKNLREELDGSALYRLAEGERCGPQ